MAKKEVKTIKSIVLSKGKTIDFQTVIEDIFSMQISRLSCYDPNYTCNPKYNGGKAYDSCSNRARAYFNPDCDYEIIIRPIKSKTK